MRSWLYFLFAAIFSTSLYASSPEIGKAAPAFKLTAVDGKTYDLGKLKGKLVVLEWSNSGCPFVHKHYDKGNMQSLQKKYTPKGVVWLTVVSSSKGAEGWFETDKEASAWTSEQKASPSGLIRDIDGKLGHLYGATATPHMFVISKTGTLAYKGAIDDKPSTSSSDIPKSRNWVSEALDALLAGKPAPVGETRAYGCRVKYAD